MNRRFAFPVIVALALLLTAIPVLASQMFNGKIRSVQDGDLITVSQKGRIVNVRLAGSHPPSRAQSLGRDAHKFLKELAKGKEAHIEVVRTAVNGDLEAHVSVGGKDLAVSLIEAGYAWATAASNDEQIAAAERAKAAKEGVYAHFGTNSDTQAGS